MEYVGLKGIDCYIGLVNTFNEYAKQKEAKETDKMKNELFNIHNMLKDPNLSMFLPNDFVYELNVNLNKIPQILIEIDKVNSDENLEQEKKEEKLTKLYKKLENEEKDFEKLLASKKVKETFLSTLRTELSSKRSVNGKVDSSLADEIITKVDALDNEILSQADKDSIKVEIEKLKAEELTIKGEKEEDLNNEEHVSSFNLEQAVETVDLDELDNKNYSKDMMVSAITHRLQQLNKDILALKKANGVDASAYSLDDAVKLQALITEQAELTKKLMHIKRNLLQVYRDLNLNSANKGIERTQNILDKIEDKKFVPKFVKTELTKHIQALKAKKGVLEAKQTMKVLVDIDALSKKTQKSSGKAAYRSVIASSRSNGEIINIFSTAQGGKLIEMAAMPRIIKLRRLQGKEEELYRDQITR